MLTDSAIEALKPYAGKRLAEKQMREILLAEDYEGYYQLVQSLLKDNTIEPIKSSGSNGMNPPLHKRYKVISQQETYDELIPKIRLLHSTINIEGYLDQPKKYKEHREWIQLLDTWIKNNIAQLGTAVSINERSFQIFHREKALKHDKDLAAVLSFNPGIQQLLNYYDTPEPFFTYNILPYNKLASLYTESRNDSMPHGNQTKVNILISENKDTWYTLRKLMNISRFVMFGIPFHILLYGEGKKINRKYSTLTDFDEITLGGFKSKYYYFGDIDYEGINIFTELTEQNPTLDIELMTSLYCKMLDKSKDILLPVTKDKQSAKSMGAFLTYFQPKEQTMLMELLKQRRYIPQEILNYGDFLWIIDNNTKSTESSKEM